MAPKSLSSACQSASDTANSTPALLLTARQSAAACGRSLRCWRSWDSAGRIPRPVRIGRSTMWRAAELAEWTAAGCPERLEWEAQR